MNAYRSFPPDKLPGWRGEELLRLSHDVGLTPRNSDRLFLPASIWPARIAYQSAVRAGAGERFLIWGAGSWLKETKNGRSDINKGMSTKTTFEEIVGGRVRVDRAERLESWKEIAVYFRRSVRCVQRWERSESLPVCRHVHTTSGTVFAYRTELEAWSRTRAADDGRSRQPRTRGPSVILISSRGLLMRFEQPAQTSWTW